MAELFSYPPQKVIGFPQGIVASFIRHTVADILIPLSQLFSAYFTTGLYDLFRGKRRLTFKRSIGNNGMLGSGVLKTDC